MAVIQESQEVYVNERLSETQIRKQNVCYKKVVDMIVFIMMHCRYAEDFDELCSEIVRSCGSPGHHVSVGMQTDNRRSGLTDDKKPILNTSLDPVDVFLLPTRPEWV